MARASSGNERDARHARAERHLRMFDSMKKWRYEYAPNASIPSSGAQPQTRLKERRRRAA
jgi:hypothetical protein